MYSVLTEEVTGAADTFSFCEGSLKKSRQSGFSLVELMVTMAIFSILMSVAFSAYQAQLRTATREYAAASDEMDLLVARNIIVRDLELGGYGVADDYSDLGASPPSNVPFEGSNGSSAPDTLVIRGTSLGLDSRASQGWSYVDSTGSFPSWGDASEDLIFGADKSASDSFILLEPTSRKLLTFPSGSTYWRFYYNTGDSKRYVSLPPSADIEVAESWPQGTLLYGLVGADKLAAEVTHPYWTVGYYLRTAKNPEDGCAPDGSPGEPRPRRLLRAESLDKNDILGLKTLTDNEAIATCVLDFQVAFGLDRNEDGSIDSVWDNGGVELAGSGWSIAQIKKRLKQIRVYMLVQSGGLDPDGYTYPNATVRVGDAVAGRDLTLTAEQRKYRWKLLTMSVTPRNMR